MAIESVGKFQQLFDRGDVKTWTQDAEFKVQEFPKVDSVGDVKETKTFGEFLSDSLIKVNDLQNLANKSMQRLATGESDNLHETMLMAEKAEIAFKQMNQIRLKVIDAYKEIMRMQL
jgi:flagellar hook-basal body complex protein FliE